MALPEFNASFQKGNLKGFQRKGLCSVERSFDASVPGGRLVQRDTGEFFAVLDGCGLEGRRVEGQTLGPNGFRTKKKPKPANLFDRFRIDHGNGFIASGEGATLTCPLDLPKGGRVRFAWYFSTSTPEETPDHAAFAGFRFVPDNLPDPHPDPSAFILAPDPPVAVAVTTKIVLLMKARTREKFSAGWKDAEVKWDGAAPFSGSIEWFVTSGHFVNSSGAQPDSAIAAAYPGCLLLDHVRLA